MASIEVNGLRYHSQIRGDGPPLVLLHGFTGSLAYWSHHVDVFARRYRVLTVDLMGHGDSESPDGPRRYGMERAAVDLTVLISQLLDEPVHLLGYSMGGRLALYMAIHHPKHIRSLILESASPGLESAQARDERQARDEALAARIEQDGIPAFVEYWESLPLFSSQAALSAEVCQRLREQRLQNSPLGLANSLRGMGTGVQPSLWSQVPKLDCPVLLLTGALDIKFVEIAQNMAALIPKVDHVIVPAAGHTVHLEQPQAFQARVLEFLRVNRDC